ncbi:uncharacterized protein [Physcomitrium patens]|uniref:tRNA pseudouridine synthase n=1 Tax=Physcomitrium patens TaxID=3218 RepID=A0A2K1IQS8_PHYPA|nr:uncharacterized protein LOC112273919 isoform X1 [Physcomitrium patens]PNR31634.1 hypothetical protein PHYPA_025755 [Physcomitrium patens]|eukprot:XP_024358741.1 uncharacterized protein LOC112273919 isoform X1 [Physcomitrella patens]
MVTVMRNCVADSPLWCGRFKPSHVCAPLREQKQVRPYVKYVFRNCSTSGSLERRDDLVEKTQPGWKWRLVISYDGTQYSGWQIQKNYVSIQEKVEDALSKFTRLPRDELKLVGAGRTDAGVHAWGQVAHFTTPTCFCDLEPLHTSLNGILPPDIRILEVSSVQPDFHARYSACRKTYQYKAYVSPVMDPFQHAYAYHIKNSVNIAAMEEAASYFVGTHNFSAFANHSADTASRDTLRDLLSFTVSSIGPQLLFEVEGKSFMYKQVRNMVGLLVQVGKELVPPSMVRTILLTEDRRELAKISPVAPAHGLYLMSVGYDDKVLRPVPNAPKASFGRWLRYPVSISA